MPHDHTQNREGGYPCSVACLLCDPAPVFTSLDHLAQHYVNEHPISGVGDTLASWMSRWSVSR